MQNIAIEQYQLSAPKALFYDNALCMPMFWLTVKLHVKTFDILGNDVSHSIVNILSVLSIIMQFPARKTSVR